MPKKAKAVVVTEKKERRQYPDRDTRIAMADEKIKQLEKLNAERRALIEKTETKLNERKAALEKSEALLAKTVARRSKLIAMNERPVDSETARAQKAAEKAQVEAIKAKLKEKGMSMEELLKLI